MTSQENVTFIGREKELSELQTALESGKKIIQITGQPMVGKTELAKHLLKKMKDFYKEDQSILHIHEVSIRNVKNIEPIISQLINQFTLSEQSYYASDQSHVQEDQSAVGYNCSSPSRQLTLPFQRILDIVHKAKHHHIILLDNAEDILLAESTAKSDFIDSILNLIEESSDLIQVVVTTRFKFRVVNHVVFYSLDLKPLQPEDAETLLELVAEGVDIQEYKIKLANLCSFLPKLLIVAGSALRNGQYTPEELSTRLEKRMSSLDELSDEGKIVIGSFMDALLPILQEKSSELQYIPGSFGPRLAAAVTGKPSTAIVKQDVLNPLCKRSLLDKESVEFEISDAFDKLKSVEFEISDAFDKLRYDIHPFIREYIRDHFSHLHDEDLVRDRFCDFFAELLHQMSSYIDRKPKSTIPLLSIEMQNIAKFLREAMHCGDERYHVMINVAQHAEYLLMNFLPSAGAVEFYEACVNSARMQNDPADCAVMLHCYGQALNQIRGNWQKARNVYKEAAELLSPMTNKQDKLARLYTSIGWNLHLLGKEREALSYFYKAYDIQKNLGLIPHRDTSSTAACLGVINTAIGELAEAKKYHDLSRSMRGDLLGDHPIMGGLQNNLGIYYNKVGNSEKAFHYFKLSLRTKKRFNKKPANDIIYSLTNVALEYSKRQDMEKALELLDEAYEMRCKMGMDHPDMALIYNTKAKVYARGSDLENAELYYKKTLEIRQKLMGKHTSVGDTMNMLGKVMLRAGKFQEAKKMFSNALEFRRKVLANEPENGGVAESLNCLTESCIQMKKYREAREYARQTVTEYQRLHDVYGEGNKIDKMLEIDQKIETVKEKFKLVFETE
ncbi:uncharacterized protein LOC100369926 [Saccoglossus kowalevskii]|uniref:Uncharacterized protein LOC100369926 n=1 Tax=Saccoglossus kowalevskii TaxID=10224 RepID=A0ABM0MG03_SACKO|nr:PREDICTED: uncharacterized protein LOC100369926 [Saccoglossus kowalevskii]